MENKYALNFFREISEKKTVKIKSDKLSSSNDFTKLDSLFILKYADKSSKILDMGSGTGLIVNKIYNKVGNITAVEPLKGFSKHIVKSNNVVVVNQNIFDFKPNIEIKYDLITMFGLMHYFNELEAIEIYKKYFYYLKNNGKMIIKNQFGVNDDVIVDGYSEEQNTNYFAHYRYLDKEVNILSKTGFYNVEAINIYPPECNRWNNTHYYAIVAEK